MKKALLLASASLFSATLSYAGGEGWMQDFEAAKKKAAEEKKDLLIDFTGSDWCPPCQDLSTRILSQESFKTAASENYILVELDFPKTPEVQAKQSAEIQQQNRTLATNYGIKGFPTILLTDAQGRPYGQTGHHPGTPEEYLAHLSDLQKAKVARDQAFTAAESAEGVDKAKALYMGLKAVPADQMQQYPKVLEMIKANDPDDTTGIVAAEAKKQAEAKEAAEMQAKMQGLNQKIQAAMQSQDTPAALKVIDDYVAEEKLEGSMKQRVLSFKISILMQAEDLEGVEKVASEVIAADPESAFSAQVKNFQETELKQMIAAKAAKQEGTEEAVPAEKE